MNQVIVAGTSIVLDPGLGAFIPRFGALVVAIDSVSFAQGSLFSTGGLKRHPLVECLESLVGRYGPDSLICLVKGTDADGVHDLSLKVKESIILTEQNGGTGLTRLLIGPVTFAVDDILLGHSPGICSGGHCDAAGAPAYVLKDEHLQLPYIQGHNRVQATDMPGVQIISAASLK